MQSPQGTFQTLSARIPGSATLTVGVPSRLYYTRTAKQPLAGVRIGVKDIYRLAGVRGSNGNRAWYYFYPPATRTGTAVQRLIDAGAQIIGLQKASQFADGEVATADWIDYHSPFNPRGDGYQDPSSSSSGGAAAIASYPWLDLALGSDTGGSIRGPAGAQGLFGNRPSHGLVNLDEVMPLSPVLDTAGLLARDAVLWDIAQSVLYGPTNYKSLNTSTSSYPKKIYALGYLYFDTRNPKATTFKTFLVGLAHLVGGTSQALILEDEWTKSGPVNASDTPLSSLLGTTYAALISKDQTSLVRKSFYDDYSAAYNGRRPFVDPVPLARWAFGDSLPEAARDEAIQNRTVFMDWFNSNILVPLNDTRACSSALAVYPGYVGGNEPRNQYNEEPPTPPLGFSDGRISVMAGCPDFSLPIGEISEFSDISGHFESYPVSVNIMAAKGCDSLLTKLAQDLVAAGLVVQPSAGQTWSNKSAS